MVKFELGRVLMTRGINDMVAESADFAKHVLDSLKRHTRGDWGDMCQEDKKANDVAVALGDGAGRLFSAYNHQGLPKVWIITEADRSATTILFPDEY